MINIAKLGKTRTSSATDPRAKRLAVRKAAAGAIGGLAKVTSGPKKSNAKKRFWIKKKTGLAPAAQPFDVGAPAERASDRDTVLERASRISGDAKRAEQWYRTSRIPALGDTAEALVAQGKGQLVLEWLDAFEDGAFA